MTRGITVANGKEFRPITTLTRMGKIRQEEELWEELIAYFFFT
jgi:hypothetical protein